MAVFEVSDVEARVVLPVKISGGFRSESLISKGVKTAEQLFNLRDENSITNPLGWFTLYHGEYPTRLWQN